MDNADQDHDLSSLLSGIRESVGEGPSGPIDLASILRELRDQALSPAEAARREARNKAHDAGFNRAAKSCFEQSAPSAGADPSVKALFERCSSLDAASRRKIESAANTLAMSSTPTKVGQALAESRKILGPLFPAAAALMLHERLAMASHRRDRLRGDAPDGERSCDALAIKAASPAPGAWLVPCLTQACKEAASGSVKAMLAAGFPAFGPAWDGQSPLVRAAAHPAYEARVRAEVVLCARALLAAGAPTDDPHDDGYATQLPPGALARAVDQRNWDLCELLIDARADVFGPRGKDEASIPDLLIQADQGVLLARAQAIVDADALRDTPAAPRLAPRRPGL